MKKLFTLSAFIFLSVMLSRAQTPTPLTSADFPHPGDSSNVTEYTISPTETFADSISANDSLTIDRCVEKALGVINDTYMNDISIGGYQIDTIPIILYSQFPGANNFHRVYGAINGFLPGVSSFPAANVYSYIVTTDGQSYVYYENVAGGFYELGSYIMPQGQAATTLVNNPKKPIVVFPVDYNAPNNVVDFESSASGGGISTVSHLNTTVDAYGKLYVITGTPSSPIVTEYENYLRVVQYNIDTMDIGSGMYFFVESKFFNYYVPGSFDPIIVYSVAQIRNNIDPTYWSMDPSLKWHDEIEVQYNKEFIPTGISETGWELNLFPNPSEGMFSLNLPAFASDVVKAEVYDFSGKIIRSEVYSGGIIQLDLTDQAEGMYTLRLSANGKIMTSKMVITR